MGLFNLFGSKKAKPEKKTTPAQVVTLFHLIDLCEVEKLDAASSFDELCRCIQKKLDDYCKTNQINRGIQYVTVDPNFIFYAEPEVILWTFLLLNPENKFKKALDSRRIKLLRNALALDPNDYNVGNSYHYDHVAEKLHCSRMEGRGITEYWEILPVYLDKDRKTINLPYLVEKSGNAKLAAKLYSMYALCSMKEAENTIQKYLSKSAGNLSNLYPGGKLEILENILVKSIDLSSDENGKAAWLSLNHPFFQAHSPNPALSAELFFDYLSKSTYRYVLDRAYGYKDYHLEYKGYLTTGYESKEKIQFVRMEQYSYHDGGGGSRDVLRILPLSKNIKDSLIIPKEIMTKEYYSKRQLFMPPCEGYWEDRGVVYLIDPFCMMSIFIIESESETWD